MPPGTELLNWLRLGIASPHNLLDIGHLDALRGIREDAGDLVIGALSTLGEIGENAVVGERAVVLAQACLKAASAQIRNRATLGGNLLQKTRCAYFRAEGATATWPCNKREPGSGCAALEGHHERHAIFGWTQACIATQPSDPAVALACLDARLELAGSEGRRTIPVAEFHLTPDSVPAAGDLAAQCETSLKPGELIVACRIPLDAAARRSHYVKVRVRESYEYAAVSAAAALAVENGVVRTVRLALGSVAAKPWRLRGAEDALVGQTPTGEAFRSAVSRAMEEARPLPGNRFKVALAGNAAVRALELAGAQP